MTKRLTNKNECAQERKVTQYTSINKRKAVGRTRVRILVLANDFFLGKSPLKCARGQLIRFILIFNVSRKSFIVEAIMGQNTILKTSTPTCEHNYNVFPIWCHRGRIKWSWSRLKMMVGQFFFSSYEEKFWSRSEN